MTAKSTRSAISDPPGDDLITLGLYVGDRRIAELELDRVGAVGLAADLLNCARRRWSRPTKPSPARPLLENSHD